MKLIIIVELFVNYILLTLFNTHMLQLNSYFFKKHFKWMRKNWRENINSNTINITNNNSMYE